MRRIAVAIVAGVASLGAASAPPTGDSLFGPDVRLGMSLDAWKAAPLSGASDVRKVCSVDHAGTTLATNKGPAALATVCGYLKPIGRFNLPYEERLGPQWFASRFRFTFIHGRLESLEYRAPVDAYNEIMASLVHRYGPPARQVRDSVRTEIGEFPRVRAIWTNPDRVIQLTDPAPPFNVLNVRFMAKGAAGGRAS
jgi:hypothetical protein